MSKIPPNEFIKQDIGSIGNNPSWNNIPTSQIKEYVPEGKSLEEVNKIKDTLKDYSKRTQQIILRVGGTGAAAGTLYSVPKNYVLFIDTITITASNGAAAVRDCALIVNSTYYIQEMRLIAGASLATPIVFNNALKLDGGSDLTYSVGAGVEYAYILTGWLEDKTLLT